MTTRTIVHLLRHGEVHNPTKILYGRMPNFYLSDLGHRMAGRAATALEPRDVAAVWSSPMERARQTAAPLAESLGLDVRLDDRLIEAANVFEGKRVSIGDGALSDPRSWRYLYNPFRPSWGEPYEHVAERMRSVIADARTAARGHEIVLVSHQLPIWIARLSYEGRRLWHDPRKRQCGLASLTSLAFDDDRLVAIVYTEPSSDLAARASKTPGS